MHLLFFNPQGNFNEGDSHLTEHPDFGGQLVYVKEIAMAMIDAGHRVDIVTRRIIDPEWPEFSASIDHYDGYEPDLRIVRIPCGGDRFLAKEQLWEQLPEFVSKTLKFYGDRLPDFVTSHYADGGYCAALMQEVTGLQFTFTGHSLGAQKLDKLGTSRSMNTKWKSDSTFPAGSTRNALQWNGHTALLLQPARNAWNNMRTHSIGVPSTSTMTTNCSDPAGVNTRVFSTRESEIDPRVKPKLRAKLKNPDQPHLLVASRVDEKKNIGGAVAAYCRSPELVERAGLVICIRGIDDPYEEIGSLSAEEQQVLEPILDMIIDANLRNRIDFLNIPSQAELAATYRFFAKRKSVFVLPSVYEPFGLAPIEAAACGLACAATENGGPSEIFEDGSGVLFNPFDTEDMAQALNEALERQVDLSDCGRRRVLDMYTWEKTAARYLAVIRDGMGCGKVAAEAVPELNAGNRISAYLEQRDP